MWEIFLIISFVHGHHFVHALYVQQQKYPVIGPFELAVCKTVVVPQKTRLIIISFPDDNQRDSIHVSSRIVFCNPSKVIELGLKLFTKFTKFDKSVGVLAPISLDLPICSIHKKMHLFLHSFWANISKCGLILEGILIVFIRFIRFVSYFISDAGTSHKNSKRFRISAYTSAIHLLY